MRVVSLRGWLSAPVRSQCVRRGLTWLVVVVVVVVVVIVAVVVVVVVVVVVWDSV